MVAAWEGKWKGTLVNLPAKPGATPVEVTMEIGAFPMTDNTCTPWKTTYSEGGVVKVVKDYKLCRGTGIADLAIDESGLRLPVRVIGDALVGPFKAGEILLVSTMRLRGEVLEEEILTVDDKPAIKDGVQPMTAKGIQRLELRRVTDTVN
jgi:hypothetical protein